MASFDRIYILYVVPEGKGTFAYRAFDTLEKAKAMENSLHNEYVNKLVTKVIVVDFDGRIMRDGEYQRVIPPGTVVGEQVKDVTTPGGVSPLLPDECGYCRKPVAPNGGIAIGSTYWHEPCLKELKDRLDYMNEDLTLQPSFTPEPLPVPEPGIPIELPPPPPPPLTERQKTMLKRYGTIEDFIKRNEDDTDAIQQYQMAWNTPDTLGK